MIELLLSAIIKILLEILQRQSGISMNLIFEIWSI